MPEMILIWSLLEICTRYYYIVWYLFYENEARKFCIRITRTNNAFCLRTVVLSRVPFSLWETTQHVRVPPRFRAVFLTVLVTWGAILRINFISITLDWLSDYTKIRDKLLPRIILFSAVLIVWGKRSFSLALRQKSAQLILKKKRLSKRSKIFEFEKLPSCVTPFFWRVQNHRYFY